MAFKSGETVKKSQIRNATFRKNRTAAAATKVARAFQPVKFVGETRFRFHALESACHSKIAANTIDP
jgi:hypothetical protein